LRAVVVPMWKQRVDVEAGSPLAEHLGRRLRRRRRVMGMTQDELAKACGLRFEEIQHFETAAADLPASHLRRLAEVLSAPVSYFYAGLDDAHEAITA
jgi:transcriptional regulator with XRE-family HTH domain